MKIDGETLERLRWAARDDGASRVSVKSDDLRAILAFCESIEQHQKDLMGLVEKWREEADKLQYGGTWSQGVCTGIGSSADDLESLINPKI